MSSLYREYLAGIEAEVERWHGASVAFEHGGKHERAVISFAGRSRTVIFPTSPSDSRRGLLNSLSDVRRLLREMGATQTTETKASGQRHRHANAPPRPIRPGEHAHREDRFFGPLAALKERMAT